MRVDLHVHTVYSPDCLTALADVPLWARRRGMDAVAITDHDAIAGALAIQQMTDFPVIVGEEVHTRQGELIGLFIQEAIPPGSKNRASSKQNVASNSFFTLHEASPPAALYHKVISI